MESKLKYLLNQYAKETATPEEERELWSIIDQAQNEDLLKSIILEMIGLQEPSKYVSNESLQSVLRKIKTDPEEISKEGILYKLDRSKKTNRFHWSKLAAAAIILLLLGGGLFYFIQIPGTDTMNLASSKTVNDITPPNSVNAIITLADGKKIVIDSAANGVLAQQGGVDITKLSSGEITYNHQVGNIGEEVSYNTLSNPAGSKAVNITLADGSKVWLNSASSLRYPTVFVGNSRKVEIHGEAYFEVSHNQDKPFYVNVRGVEVEVLGTHFNVNSYDDEDVIKTTLLEGSVRISDGMGSNVLQPGQQAQVYETIKKSMSISRPDLNEVTAWKNGRFYYNNSDLENIMRQIARWYNVEVIFKDNINYQYTVDVSRDVPVSQLFRFIEMSGGVYFNIQGRTIVVRNSP